MDRLQVNQQLNANEELVSNSGWFRLGMFANGSFGVYRTQTGRYIWAPNVVGQPGSFVVMQGDGNFVARNPDGSPFWATNTAGPSGIYVVVLQDDGNLVVYDSANRPLWASNTVQDLHSPTIRYSSDGRYLYNETSECRSFKSRHKQLRKSEMLFDMMTGMIKTDHVRWE
jgi:hypothetical protein